MWMWGLNISWELITPAWILGGRKDAIEVMFAKSEKCANFALVLAKTE